MIELTADDRERICDAPAVRHEIAGVGRRRRAASWLFWVLLATALGGAVALYVADLQFGDAPRWLVPLMVALFGSFGATIPLDRVRGRLKSTVMAALAERTELSFSARPPAPRGYEEARRRLFGTDRINAVFSDGLAGDDEDGRRFEICHASLDRQSAESTETTLFAGRLYAFERAGGGGGELVLLPRGTHFSSLGAGRGLGKVDGAEAGSYTAYAGDPDSARRLLAGGRLVALLEKLGDARMTSAWIGPSNALVAVAGVHAPEAGRLLSAEEGQRRAKILLDEVCAALESLAALRRAVDEAGEAAG